MLHLVKDLVQILIFEQSYFVRHLFIKWLFQYQFGVVYLFLNRIKQAIPAASIINVIVEHIYNPTSNVT